MDMSFRHKRTVFFLLFVLLNVFVFSQSNKIVEKDVVVMRVNYYEYHRGRLDRTYCLISKNIFLDSIKYLPLKLVDGESPMVVYSFTKQGGYFMSSELSIGNVIGCCEMGDSNEINVEVPKTTRKQHELNLQKLTFKAFNDSLGLKFDIQKDMNFSITFWGANLNYCLCDPISVQHYGQTPYCVYHDNCKLAYITSINKVYKLDEKTQQGIIEMMKRSGLKF